MGVCGGHVAAGIKGKIFRYNKSWSSIRTKFSGSCYRQQSNANSSQLRIRPPSANPKRYLETYFLVKWFKSMRVRHLHSKLAPKDLSRSGPKFLEAMWEKNNHQVNNRCLAELLIQKYCFSFQVPTNSELSIMQSYPKPMKDRVGNFTSSKQTFIGWLYPAGLVVS